MMSDNASPTVFMIVVEQLSFAGSEISSFPTKHHLFFREKL